MQHLIINFTHQIQDVIPFCQFIEGIRPVLSEAKIGHYVGDDMAIDGGDAEAIFSGADARSLLSFLEPHLRKLPFLRNAQVTLVFGALDSGAESCQLTLN